MATIPEKRTETVFQDWKPAFTPLQAAEEAARCLYCYDPPCQRECPSSIDVPQFVRKIATGNLHGAARTVFADNILGMSCGRVCPVEVLCQGHCVLSDMGLPPVQIGRLQRFVTDWAYTQERRFFEAGPDTGKSVALVGGGPASLACAHELRLAGHACTIYEKRELLGGLNTSGIAPYKMRADRSLAEVEWILGVGGIDVVKGVEVGKDITFAELEEKHDAVFVGIGLGPDRLFRLPGEELPGIEGALGFIERLKLGEVSLDGVRNVIVLGAGNTALDAVRETLEIGDATVRMWCTRGAEEAKSGYTHEWDVARKQGALASWNTVPTEYVATDGRVSAVRCQRTDENKPIKGTEHDLPADLVLIALGQSRIVELLEGLDGIEIERGMLKLGEDGSTGRPGYYAGGDCANGGKEVVNAAAEGRDAAKAIHRYLSAQ